MSITELENKIYREKMQEACKELQKELESRDEELSKSRDRKRYRDKGRRQSVLKTKMGEVTFNRKIYLDLEEKEYVYLLDEELGLTDYGKISPGVAELVAKSAAESSYRETAREIREMTGLNLSHQTAWTLTQTVGEQLRKRPLEPGTAETKVLYEETDGVYLRMQGKSRRGHVNGSREMKLGIAYSGIRENGKRRNCEGKVAFGMFGDVDTFLERKEAEIASRYDVGKIETRLYNGDGAGWIMGNSIATGRWQLDRFHRNKAILTFLNEPEMRRQVHRYLAEKDIPGCLEYLEACVNSSRTEKEQEDRQALLNYFTNNRDYLLSYTESGQKMPALNEGLVPARMGAMESNVFSMVAGRMKRNRCCWSENGANNLVCIICLKNTGRLDSALRTIRLPQLIAETETKAESRVYRAPLSVGRGYNGFHSANTRPAKKTIHNLCEE